MILFDEECRVCCLGSIIGRLDVDVVVVVVVVDDGDDDDEGFLLVINFFFYLLFLGIFRDEFFVNGLFCFFICVYFCCISIFVSCLYKFMILGNLIVV